MKLFKFNGKNEASINNLQSGVGFRLRYSKLLVYRAKNTNDVLYVILPILLLLLNCISTTCDASFMETSRDATTQCLSRKTLFIASTVTRTSRGNGIYFGVHFGEMSGMH